jgi:hypothetical protein
MNNAEVKEQLALAARLSTSRNIRTLAAVCRGLLDRVEQLEAQVNHTAQVDRASAKEASNG